ncbi:MAG: Gfo/Idh/MocA family oxidoreductase, partial [Gemmataceae bacterium]|nr:Gfo/Idh/MocA family oxidoreductase [Gemmataceae bacterium]
MATDKKVRVAIVGLGFGAEFIPIYQAHPNAEMYAICRRNKIELERCQKHFGVPKAYSDYDELLKDPNIDA